MQGAQKLWRRQSDATTRIQPVQPKEIESSRSDEVDGDQACGSDGAGSEMFPENDMGVPEDGVKAPLALVDVFGPESEQNKVVIRVEAKKMAAWVTKRLLRRRRDHEV